MLIVQMTDLHVVATSTPLFGRVDTRGHFLRAIDHLRALMPKPDVLVMTGDLADSGSPEEYEIVYDALERLSIPAFIVPGNHDNREGMRSVFQRHHYVPRSGYI